MIKAKPVLDYVEGLWQGESSARRGIGVRLPKALEGMDLERYGIKPTPLGGQEVTNEMVNRIRDEMGI